MIVHIGDERLPERIWRHVQPEYNSGCWLWTGEVNWRGYGIIKKKRVHRLLLETKLGKELGDLKALHRCDNPSCCNPDHLFAGTIQDNNRDMWAKGRQGGCVAAHALKTHCLRGHSLSDAFIFRNGGRSCSHCKRRRDRERRAAAKANRTPSNV